MPNLVASIRQAVLNVHPEAVVVERGKNFIRHEIAPDVNGNRRFVLDTSLGNLHYHDGVTWQEINTDWVNSTEVGYADKCDQAHFTTHVDANSGRKIYPRRGITTEYFILGRPQYWTGTKWQNINVPARVRTGQDLDWENSSYAIHVDHTGAQLKVTVVLKTGPAFARVRWPLTLVGLTWSNFTLVAQSDSAVVATFPQPSLTDNVGVTRAVATAYVGGAIEYNPDLTGLTYPVVIDPTLDLQVGAGANDGYWLEHFFFDAADTELDAGYQSGGPNRANFFARFTSVTVPQGATIGANTYLSCRGGVTTTTAYNAICAIAADNAAAPTTEANAESATRTTAAVNWDGAFTVDTWYNSPGISSVVSEVVARAGWASGNAMVIYVEGRLDSGAFARFNSYELTAANAPKLHIEYTSGSTLTRTSTPTTVALKSTKLRTSTPTTVALLRTLTRTSTPTTVALKGTLTRTSTPSTVALKSTLTRTVTPNTVALWKTLTRTSIPTTTALKSTLTRTSTPTTTALKSILTRTSTPSTVALRSTLTRTATSTVALSGTFKRTATATVALKGTLTRTATTTTALSGTFLRTVTSTVAVQSTLLRTSTPSTVSVGTRFGRPSSDISTGSWTTTPLWSKLDEV